MDTQSSRFNRILFAILALLYGVAIFAFTYLEWAAEPQPELWWMMLANALILSVPLVLLFGSIYVLVVAWREHRATGQVNPRLAKIIHWMPRIAAILMILFVGLFSLDVFEPGAPLSQMLLGFLIHNIPTILLIVVLILAWIWPAVGFVAFLVAAACFAIISVRSGYFLPNLLFFMLPILFIAGLFYVDWKWLAQPSRVDAAAQP
jgi:hypothetical protein